jgi:predicted glycosyltransferase
MTGRILVDITHPADVHFFRPAMRIWQEKGYGVTIAARDKDVALQLLDHYGFEYTVLSRARKGLLGLTLELLEHEGRLLKLIRRARPDVILEFAGTFVVHAAALTRTPALVFTDTEHATFSNAITFPFATKVITPECFQGDLGRKHVRFNGYKELAYLRPDYFQPNQSILAELGLEEGEAYSLLRFVSWDASHDWGHEGASLAFKKELVAALEGHGRVIISSEASLPAEFESYRLPVAPHRMHDLLAFAQLYIGEGATMASEAAVLGTPAVYINPLSAGTIEELEQEYGLVFSPHSEKESLSRSVAIMCAGGMSEQWSHKRDRMLAEKEDITAFICDQVEQLIELSDKVVA